MSLHRLLASMVANDKSAINLIEDPLYTFFSCYIQDPLVFDFHQFLYVSKCGSLQVYSTWASWTYRSISFKFDVLAPFASSFPSKTPILCMLVHLMVSHRCVRLFLFFPFFFLSAFQKWIISIWPVIFPFPLLPAQCIVEPL